MLAQLRRAERPYVPRMYLILFPLRHSYIFFLMTSLLSMTHRFEAYRSNDGVSDALLAEQSLYAKYKI